jgi:NADP-dependent 3-hydroxy acid dehydrogenase YdfG
MPVKASDTSFPLGGRTALVTGASRGIGEAIAEALAGAGARVALLARTESALREIATRIGRDAVAVAADLTDETVVANAVARVCEEFGGAPDILVNNAGLFQIAGIESTSPGEISSIISTNLIAPFLLLNNLLPLMRKRGSGHVVTIGSIADRTIFAGNGAYSATKFGMRGVHEVLREETRGSGIRATLVSPASVDTDIWEPIRYYGDAGVPDRRGMLDVRAVADAVLFAVTRPASVNIDELRLSRS